MVALSWFGSYALTVTKYIRVIIVELGEVVGKKFLTQAQVT